MRHIHAAPFQRARKIIGISGAPASGKSTLAEQLVAALNVQSDHPNRVACVVPMDGFHLDNETLDARGLRHRKGAAETFDSHGFVELVQRLTQEDDVRAPTFDRDADSVVPNGLDVTKDHRIVVVEGNYLHLTMPPWSDLSELFDLSYHIAVPMEELRRRLIERWVTHGFTKAQAIAKAEQNDLPNARFVAENSMCLNVLQLD